MTMESNCTAQPDGQSSPCTVLPAQSSLDWDWCWCYRNPAVGWKGGIQGKTAWEEGRCAGVHLLLDVTVLSLPGHLCVCAGSWSPSVSLLPFASRTCSLPVSCAEAVFELPRPEVDADPIFILGCELSLQTRLLKLKITGCGSFVKVRNEAPSLAGSCLLSPEPRLLSVWREQYHLAVSV